MEAPKTNKIVERVVNIVQRRGADNGTRFEVGYNIEEIHETEMAYPVSALWGWGGSVEDENGNDSRFIDFADVVWSKANGDPVDKPKGQKWVEYPPAKEKFGLQTPDGVINVEGKWQDENIKDPVELLQKTYHHLVNEASQIQTNYSFEVALTNETVELGDTCLALDRTIPDPIEFFGRVIALEYDVSDQTFPATVEMGQFLSVYEPDTRLDQIEDKIREIEQGRDIVVDDNSFPDTKPPTPTKVVVKGLFEKVAIDWNYEPFSYIAAYEIYGSQVKDFTPDTVNFSNRLWRGKSGGWIHEAAVDQVWYYRIRSVNTRGTPSNFTAQFSAATTRIGTNHIEKQSITNALIKDLSADKITAGTIKGITIEGSLIRGGRLEPISPSSQYESYIEANTIFQKRNFDWRTVQYYQYESLDISAGKIVQETGTQNFNDPKLNRATNRTTIEYGKITLDGGQEFDTADVSKMQMYAQNTNDESGYDTFSAIDVYTNDQRTMSLKHGIIGVNQETIWDIPSSGFKLNTGGDFYAKNKSGYMWFETPGTMRLDSDTRVMLGREVHLPAKTFLYGGDTPSYDLARYHALGINIKKQLTDIYGSLQCNGMILLDFVDVSLGSGSAAYGSTQYFFQDESASKAENIFAVFAQPYGGYSNACTAGIEAMSSTGFKVFVRGTGTTSAVGDRTMRVLVCIFYEVP